MTRIQELAEQLANQIAAGEVVERPSSVVKELVENSIDAKSTQIQIFIEEAGLKKIQVVDNGEGISNEDVTTAFKRHATSKIHTREDLFRIQTLGFRGEALPSIASVSEIEIETAREEEESGSFLRLVGGKIEENKQAPLRVGTKMTIANLFFNTPARLKYVKTLQTELAKISDIVNRLALSHPHIAFRLVHEKNQLLVTSGNGELKTAIAGIYGIGNAKKMVAISASDLDFQVEGYVSLPELTRASNHYVTVMINGRYIKNYNINRSLLAGYGSKIMGGRFPIAVVNISMDTTLVDVNVHPTKQEVRLSKEQELIGLITRAVQEALQEKQLIPQGGEALSFKKTVESPDFKPKQELLSMKNREVLSSRSGGLNFDSTSGRFFVKEEQFPIDPPVKKEQIPLPEKIYKKNEEVASKQKEVANHFPELEYFGQMHGTYLFAQSREGLYLIDQHAAQERIKYEYFREAIGKVDDSSQELLMPIVLNYPNSDVLKLQEKKELLEEVGIFLESYGENAFILRSHPTWYPKGEEEKTVREMVDRLLEKGNVSVKEFRKELAIMMSCKGSIKANHSLDDTQARMLLAELATCKNPYNCPHGRPVLVHISNYDIQRMFKRIQDPHEKFK